MASKSVQQQLTGMSLDERWYVLNFDLRISSRYHTERRRFFERLHTFVAALSAVFGSATVVALLTEFPAGKQVAVALSFTVAVLAAMDSVIGFSKKAADHRDLARRFVLLECEFLSSRKTEDAYTELISKRRVIEAEEPPSMPYLVRRCHVEIARVDGHSPGDPGVPKMNFLTTTFAQFIPSF